MAGGMEWLGGNAFYGLRAGSSRQDAAGTVARGREGREDDEFLSTVFSKNLQRNFGVFQF